MCAYELILPFGQTEFSQTKMSFGSVCTKKYFFKGILLLIHKQGLAYTNEDTIQVLFSQNKKRHLTLGAYNTSCLLSKKDTKGNIPNAKYLFFSFNLF